MKTQATHLSRGVSCLLAFSVIAFPIAVAVSKTPDIRDAISDDSIKMEVIVTFIAILEMVKRGRLHFMQTEASGPIWIQHPGVDEDVGEEIEFTDFDLTEEQQQFLVEAGREGVKQYLQWRRSVDGKKDIDTVYKDMA